MWRRNLAIVGKAAKWMSIRQSDPSGKEAKGGGRANSARPLANLYRLTEAANPDLRGRVVCWTGVSAPAEHDRERLRSLRLAWPICPALLAGCLAALIVPIVFVELLFDLLS